MSRKWYPKSKRNNKNVPKSVKIIGTLEVMQGTILETYYKQDSKVYCVSDWVGDKPQEVSGCIVDLCQWNKKEES